MVGQEAVVTNWDECGSIRSLDYCVNHLGLASIAA